MRFLSGTIFKVKYTHLRQEFIDYFSTKLTKVYHNKPVAKRNTLCSRDEDSKHKLLCPPSNKLNKYITLQLKYVSTKRDGGTSKYNFSVKVL